MAMAWTGAPRLFAVIPAAGESRRMGQPKLVLPLGGRTVVEHLLAALASPLLTDRVVVTRAADVELQRLVTGCGARVVTTQPDPPDMRASLEAGLADIARRWQPRRDDGWLMLPADYPRLNAATVQQLIAVWLAERPRFLLPTHNGRRGHPLLARWDTVADLLALPPDAGMNRLVQSATDIRLVPCDDRGVLLDLDRPEDYTALLQETAPLQDADQSQEPPPHDQGHAGKQ